MRFDSEACAKLYQRLFAAYGPQGWWPGWENPLAVCFGAILVQRTTWGNAARALSALEDAGLLSFGAIQQCPLETLSARIRSVGFHNAKAVKLNAFSEYMETRWGGSFERASRLDVAALRRELLDVHGIGEETADAMLVYAFGKPSFVMDAYSRRILKRLGWIAGDESYEALQRGFEEAIPREVEYYGEFHALLVQHAKQHCRMSPVCEGCPLPGPCACAVTLQEDDG